MPLSPDDIRAKQFATVRFKEGYRLEEVDAFLDEIEAEIARLTSENAELRSQVAQALSADLAAMAAPAAAAVVVASDPTVEMARLLQMAEATAQARVAQAGDEAEAILLRARVDAQRSVEDTAAERAAQENSERFDSLAAGLPQILYMRRVDGEFEYLNEQFYRSTGLTAGALGHDGWLAAVHPDDIRAVNEAFERVAATGINEELRLRLRMVDGAYELFGGPLTRLDGRHGKDIKWIAGLVYPHERRAQYR